MNQFHLYSPLPIFYEHWFLKLIRRKLLVQHSLRETSQCSYSVPTRNWSTKDCGSWCHNFELKNVWKNESDSFVANYDNNFVRLLERDGEKRKWPVKMITLFVFEYGLHCFHFAWIQSFPINCFKWRKQRIAFCSNIYNSCLKLRKLFLLLKIWTELNCTLVTLTGIFTTFGQFGWCCGITYDTLQHICHFVKGITKFFGFLLPTSVVFRPIAMRIKREMLTLNGFIQKLP